MKVSITNIDNNYDGANIMIKQIVGEVLEDLNEELGATAKDIKLEELSAVYTVKPEDSEDYHVISVEHDGTQEMLGVDYNLSAGVKDDNVEISLFSDQDKEVIYSEANKRFDTVESKLDESELEFISQRVVGDMIVREHKYGEDRLATQVFQIEDDNPRLIQEFSHKEEE